MRLMMDELTEKEFQAKNIIDFDFLILVINNLFNEMMQEISAKNLLNESIVSPIKNET